MVETILGLMALYLLVCIVLILYSLFIIDIGISIYITFLLIHIKKEAGLICSFIIVAILFIILIIGKYYGIFQFFPYK